MYARFYCGPGCTRLRLRWVRGAGIQVCGSVFAVLASVQDDFRQLDELVRPDVDWSADQTRSVRRGVEKFSSL